MPDGGEMIVSFEGAEITPGKPNSVAIDEIVINEILTHTDPPLEDAIELHNVSDHPVDIGHWWLSDTPSQPRKFRVQAGTIIPASGFIVFYEGQFGAGPNGFALNSYEGENVVLSTGDPEGRLTGRRSIVSFGPLRNGVSVGRHPTSIGVDFVPLQSRTFGVDAPASLPHFRQGTGAENSPPRVGPVVINEIHFLPEGSDTDEFIELHNIGDAAVPMFDPDDSRNTWRIRGGVSFDFPEGVSLSAGGHLIIVPFEPDTETALAVSFRERLGAPDSVLMLGPFDGRLNDSGETLEILHPDKPESVDLTPYETLERITFSTSAPWPDQPFGAGTSLQRGDPLSYGNDPVNWGPGVPTPGRPNKIDSDGDGLPDQWELDHQLDPHDKTDAGLDSDGDGHSNLEEFVAGTHPEDPDDFFRINALQIAGNEWTISFKSSMDRTYRVESSPDILLGDWQSIDIHAETQEEDVREITIIPPVAGTVFIRLVVASSFL